MMLKMSSNIGKQGDNLDESLANLSVYNMNIIDPKLVGNTSSNTGSLHTANSSHSHKVRPSSGKKGRPPRPFSAKQLTASNHNKSQNEASSPQRDLHLSGVATCQPHFYYDESPASPCHNATGDSIRRENCSSSLANEELLYYPRVPCSSPAVPLYSSSQSKYFSDSSSQSTSRSTGSVDDANSSSHMAYDWSNVDRLETKKSGQIDSNHLVESKYKHMLTLALPDTQNSADEEEEIPTLRLLDDLHIDLTSGKVTVTEELKARLADTRLSPESERASVSKNRHQTTSSDADGQKDELEAELKALLYRKPQNTKDTRSSLRMSQSVDCWAELDDAATGALPGSTVHYNAASDTSLAGTLLSSSVHSTVANDTKSTGAISDSSYAHISKPVTPKTPIDWDQRSVNKLAYNGMSGQVLPTPTNINNYDIKESGTNKIITDQDFEKEEELLYRWNIDISKSEQIGDIEIPLVNKERDYEAIDDEINQRVEEIERQLELQILESQKTINRLQAEADGTEFTIPKFLEISQQSQTTDTADASGATGQPTDHLENKGNAREKGVFSEPARDYNVDSQAKKFGLKSRNVTNVWEAVTPSYKKKYAVSPGGKVNVSNVTSKVNSGIKGRRGPPRSKSKTCDATPKDNNVQLVITPGTKKQLASQSTAHVTSNQSEPTTTTASHNRKVTFSNSPTIERKSEVPIKKVIKTLTFAEGSEEVVENNQVTTFTPSRPPTSVYKVPEHVKAHLEKCAKKPPARPKSANKKVESTTVQDSPHVVISNKRQARVQSAPVVRKLNRERSQERKLLSGYVNGVTTDKAIKERSVNDKVEYSSAADEIKNEPINDRPRHLVERDYVTTAIALENENCSPQTTDTLNNYQGGLAGETTHSRPKSPYSHKASNHTKKGSVSKPSRRVQSAPVRRRVVTNTSPTYTATHHVEREDPMEIEQIEQVYHKVQHLGIDLDKSTLDRSLFPPAEQPVGVCQKEMGRKFYTAGLLSSPEKWLKAEYKKLREAQRLVQKAERQMNKSKSKHPS